MLFYLLAYLNVVTVPFTPDFNYNVWEYALHGYSDAKWVLDGIYSRFDIGWIDGKEPTHVDNPSIPTTSHEKLDITLWLDKRHAAGQLLGPFTEDTCPYKDAHFSPVFTVSKPDFGTRIVGHLSFPHWGVSVNDCIDELAKHVTYILFVEVAKFVYDLGYDARLWVVDAKDAYYRIPIKEKYWKYMAIKWLGFIFIFTSLQMGLASACAIYQRFADAILWIIRTRTAQLFATASGFFYIHHYLDDFFGGHPNAAIANNQVIVVYLWFMFLGIPTQWKKLKWPNWRQIILGWLYDTRAQTVSLPAGKAIAYIAHITKIIRERRSGVFKKVLERIIGELEHAAVAVYPGKARLRNLHHALHLDCYDYKTKIYLDDATIRDLKWWIFALKHMNGIPLTWIFSDPTLFHDEVWTDAALKGDLKVGGMGGCTDSGYAYQLDNRQTLAYAVSLRRKGVDIMLLELLALYAMMVQMAPRWQYKNVRLWCDNRAVVYAVSDKKAPLIRRDMNHIIIEMCKLSVEYRFRFWIEWIKGDFNILADRLSRFKKLYVVDDQDPDQFHYFQRSEMIKIVNEVFVNMLDYSCVPRNDDDPKKYA